MATEIKIHRGNQIGGCVTEIWTEKTRILIDFGEELPGSRNTERFELDWNHAPDGRALEVSAVLFTHYHGDHIGRFAKVPDHVPLCMGALSRDVLKTIHSTLADVYKDERAQPHRRAVYILESETLPGCEEKRVRCFCPTGADERMMEPVEIGDIMVTPCRVDHSASDAYMFLIKTPDQTILHTGDFRGHGIAGECGEAVLKDVGRFREEFGSIDTLIIEGTMMSRPDQEAYSEAELYQDACRLFQSGHRHVFLIVSSTNLESIYSFYRAAADYGIPMYCHNPYVAEQLRNFAEHLGWCDGLKGVQVVEQKPVDKIQREQMRNNGFVTIIKATSSCKALIWNFRACKPVVVYSMWKGYVDRGLDQKLCQFFRWCGERNIPAYPFTDSSYGPLHTGGHASQELLSKVIKTAVPKELIPIHTEAAREFRRLIPDELETQIQIRLEKHQMITKEEAIAKGYSEESDHRALNKPALKKFLPGGSHRAFIELVHNHSEELAFCFRGNSHGQATIYYRNHIVFRIKAQGGIEFDFGHARYLETANQRKLKEDLEKELKKFGFDLKEDQDGGLVSAPPPEKPVELEPLYEAVKQAIESFSEKKGLTEKLVQQKLFLSCKELENGYYFYDMEFSQPESKMLECTNQPDMLAIRFDEKGKPKSLVFVEVKSTEDALKGPSGIRSHVLGMESYPDWLLPIRGRDACNILNQYIDVGLLKGRSEPFEEKDFAQLPKEVLLIFTGEDADGKRTLQALERDGHQAFLEEEMRYKNADGVIPQPAGIQKMRVFRKVFG